MILRSTRDSPVLEWGWAGAALDGAAESGDLHVVIPLPYGALLAVIDGLGHGPEAAEAARDAASVLTADPTLSIPELLERCHEGLRKTRGVVMTLVALDARSSTIEWFGVGNVEGLLFHVDSSGRRSQQAVNARGGVLGCRLPPAKIGTTPIFDGDVLVLATDGLRCEFSAEIALEWAPQGIADWLLQRYARGTDDALVLVARYLGATP
jgi:negative regulator of sigma-B (phosphoserine phosphatase)